MLFFGDASACTLCIRLLFIAKQICQYDLFLAGKFAWELAWGPVFLIVMFNLLFARIGPVGNHNPFWDTNFQYCQHGQSIL